MRNGVRNRQEHGRREELEQVSADQGQPELGHPCAAIHDTASCSLDLAGSQADDVWVAADAGGGLAHGIEMVQEGPHKGRLALARHFDCDPNGDPPELQRDFVLYSDDKVRSANRPTLASWLSKNPVGLRV